MFELAYADIDLRSDKPFSGPTVILNYYITVSNENRLVCIFIAVSIINVIINNNSNEIDLCA